MTHFVSEIFSEPKYWGLRGDPFLWKYLKNYYATIEIPYSVERLKKDIMQIFKNFTGEFPVQEKIYFVEKFSKTHVGISTRKLSGNFWINVAIPMLSERLEKINTL
ncbi:hypothetical protein AAK894_01650 [Lachnospiraceae bacterium 46-61]